MELGLIKAYYLFSCRMYKELIQVAHLPAMPRKEYSPYSLNIDE